MSSSPIWIHRLSLMAANASADRGSAWDPVETWSLLSWLVYGVALHLRITLGWRGRKLAWLLAFAIIGVLVSFWGVNLVMTGSLHMFNVD